jgi:DNA-binding GntR family transcriptional regulator
MNVEERVPQRNRNSKPARDDLVQRAYELTREAVLSGEFAPGSPLRLGQLAARSSVSIIPVREALRRLQAERLIEIVPNQGARVAPISIEEVVDIYRVRILLETEAVRLALGRLLPSQLDPLDGWISEMVEHLKRGELALASERHRDIHFAWYAPADSPWLMRLISVMWDNAERYLRRAPHLRASPDEFGEEHRKVLRAIRTGDPEIAMSALRDDLGRTAELLRSSEQALEDENGSPRRRSPTAAAESQ